MDCVPWNNCWIWQCTAALQSFCHPWCRLIKFLHLTLIVLKALMPSTDWAPQPPAVMEPRAFPEQGKACTFFYFQASPFLSLHPKGSESPAARGGVGGGRRLQTQPNPASRAFHPHATYTKSFCSFIVSLRRESTKQNPEGYQMQRSGLK